MGLHPLNRYHHFRGTWHIGGLVEKKCSGELTNFASLAFITPNAAERMVKSAKNTVPFLTLLRKLLTQMTHNNWTTNAWAQKGNFFLTPSIAILAGQKCHVKPIAPSKTNTNG